MVPILRRSFGIASLDQRGGSVHAGFWGELNLNACGGNRQDRASGLNFIPGSDDDVILNWNLDAGSCAGATAPLLSRYSPGEKPRDRANLVRMLCSHLRRRAPLKVAASSPQYNRQMLWAAPSLELLPGRPWHPHMLPACRAETQSCVPGRTGSRRIVGRWRVP